MDASNDRRWVLSVVAALVVGAVVVAGWWLAQPRSGTAHTAGVASGSTAGGGTSSEPGDRGDAGSAGKSAGKSAGGSAGGSEQPAIGRDPVLIDQGVRVDRYAVRGHRLVLRYTSGLPECYGEVEVARVAEEADAVTVTLVTVPPEKSADACIDLAVVGTVAVELAAPLGERQLLDGAFEPAVLVRRGTDGDGVPGAPGSRS